MQYEIQEGSLQLKGNWQDQSLNVLMMPDPPVRGINLVVSRQPLKEDEKFSSYIRDQKQLISKNFNDFKLLADQAGEINGLKAHFLEFTWDKDGTPAHQLMTMYSLPSLMLCLTATSPSQMMDSETRDVFLKIMRSFRVRHQSA